MPEARIGSGLWRPRPAGRYRSRFFELVGRETTYASSGSHNFFTLSCHRQTYQNYEQPHQRLQNKVIFQHQE